MERRPSPGTSRLFFLRHRERRAVHRRFGPSHGDVDRLLDVESGPKTMEMTHLPPSMDRSS